MGAGPNPGNPYRGSLTQKAFATLGGPDAAGTLAEMATRALKASWFHKWIKDLRMRPEEYGALVHARKTGASPMPQAAAALHADVLNSAALPIINSIYGSYLLPQAFPEGSPTHPCYPTGHGTVGGACVTALKFFFKGDQKLQPLLTTAGRDVYEPSADGLEPSWGKLELMMSLAYMDFSKTPPNLEAAERTTRAVLEIVPYWHYVRDILLPQIEAAKMKEKPQQSNGNGK